jgi:hypothetical protein
LILIVVEKVNSAPAGAGSLKNKFEDLAKPEPKPQIIKGKTTYVPPPLRVSLFRSSLSFSFALSSS